MMDNPEKDYTYDYIAVAGVILFLLNYIYGRYALSKKMNIFYKSVNPLLSRCFKDVGVQVWESDNSSYLWSSGNKFCLGLYSRLDLDAKQDLLNVAMSSFGGQAKEELLSLEIVFDPEVKRPNAAFALIRAKETAAFLENSNFFQFLKSKYSGSGSYCGLSGFDYVGDGKTVMSDIVGQEFLTFLAQRKDSLVSVLYSDVPEPEVFRVSNIRGASVLKVTFLYPNDDADLVSIYTAVLKVIRRVNSFSLHSDVSASAVRHRTDFAAILDKARNAEKLADDLDAKANMERLAERERRMKMSKEELAKEEEKERKKMFKKMAKQKRVVMK